MKIFTCGFLLLLAITKYENVFSQNVLLNILTQNTGIVSKNKLVFLEVSISNTSGTKTVPAYKLRPQISFPANLVSIADSGHTLPAGWKIVSNKNAVVILSNGTDIIPQNASRTILIAMRAKAVGGPYTISGNLTFSDGKAPGLMVGTATVGDNIADNTSTTTVKVVP
jgi:hypothetical protein